MMSFDWNGVIIGLAIGVIVSTVFFAGLGLGMRMALRSAKPVALLVLSGALRSAGLLGIGWLIAERGGPWPLAGYAAAFLIVRVITTTVVTLRPSGDAQ